MGIRTEMNTIQTRTIEEKDKDWIIATIQKEWGANFVVAHGNRLFPIEYPGFIAIEGDTRIGLITYQIKRLSWSATRKPWKKPWKKQCEIITINSIKENKGAGKALINSVLSKAKASNCSRIWLITTNDNIRALHFFQKNHFIREEKLESSFRFVALYRNALKRSRKLKPSIPMENKLNNIPIRDEIELEIELK